MNLVRWFHRGTAPMVAIYPDNLEGGALSPMSRADGLRPVRWEHNGSGPAMAIYPGDVDGTLRALPLIDRDPGLAPVRWFHSGRYPMVANFNAELPVSGGGAEYEGPLDLMAGAVAAYGVRALSAAMLGENIFRLQRDSDNAEMDFAADAVTGEAPVAAIATWLDGALGLLVLWYDQSGGGNNLVGADQYQQWNAAGFNGKPAFVTSGSLILLQSAGNATLPDGEASVFGILSDGCQVEIGDGGNASYQILHAVVADAPWVFGTDGTNSAGGDFADDISGTHLLSAAWEFGALSLKVDGVVNAVNSSWDDVGALSSISQPSRVETTSAGTNTFSEVIWYGDIPSAGQELAVNQNIATYYGVTLP